jgi:uncharacterized protein YhaN
LLFSAAAGVSDLSLVLDGVERRSEELYKKGGSKSVFAGLKRQLDELAAQIRDTDVSASAYRQRKQAVDDAKHAEDQVRVQRKDKLNAQAKLAALAKALPMVAQIAELEHQLEPLQHFPATIDIDPEKLVEISRQRIVLEAEKTRLEATIAAKSLQRDAIIMQPEWLHMANPLADLKDLRDRVGSAATDLPRRNSQRDDVVQDMIRSLADIGLKDVQEPQRFVFDQTLLSELEAAFNAVSHAEQALQAAANEENEALDHLKAAEKTLEELPSSVSDAHDLKRILETQDALNVVAETNKATEALRFVQHAADDARMQLSVNGQTFDLVPELALSAQDATALARTIETAQAAFFTAEDAVAQAEETALTLAARLKTLETSGAFITDDDASLSRRERDRLWEEHLGNLEKSSADAFEAAMRLDDTNSAARLSQTKDLAEVRQLKATLAEAQSKVEAKQSVLQTAKARLAEAQSAFEYQRVASGLMTKLSASGFADWVGKVEVARARAIEAQSERLKAEPAMLAAERLRKDLAAALNAPDAKLKTLVMMAEKTVAEYEKHQIARNAAQKVAENARIAQQKRTETRMAAKNNRQAAGERWSQLIASVFGSAGQAMAFPQAIEAFRKLRELNEKRLGFQRQIDAMMADQQAFDDAVMPFIAENPDLGGLSTLEAYDTFVARSQSALNAADAQQKLTADIREAEEKLRSVRDTLQDIDAHVRLQAAIFAATIPTDTVEELREAVLHAKHANDMRQQIRTLSHDLCTLLNVHSKAEAEALLEGKSLSDVQAGLSEIERDLSTLEATLTAAIENRTRAQSEFDAITGDAEIAALVARRQTIELEMENVIRQVSELRVGHMLADAAIRRYRDVHRSSMMQAADVAFAELTNGAYRGLKTQVDGATELLVAIQASDGAAKQAYDMSKGTRFQLYLALRAAAYEQMAQNGTVLPFFCDDIFETFDENRTRAACHLLQRIGMKGQSIYLTHHKHVVDIARDVCGEEVRIHEV